MTSIDEALRLNGSPLPECLDRSAVDELLRRCPGIFSDTRLFVARAHMDAMARAVAAIDRIGRLPGWQAAAAGGCPPAPHAGRGVFFGFDFHIDGDGPKLIEINTNAGGGLLNVELLRAQRGNAAGPAGVADASAVEGEFVAMFREEWRAAGRSGQPDYAAIVDDRPDGQYFLPEFELARAMFARMGMEAEICDPSRLALEPPGLLRDGRRVDLVYNRLTDFALAEPAHAALREAWRSGVALVTPDPRAYAVYADKRNLVRLGEDAWLASVGATAADRDALRAVLPTTEQVTAEHGEDLWLRRKGLFFKPASGYGSKAVYRGQNVTRGVFASILAGDYVAQTLVPPGVRQVAVDGMATGLKYDVRCYAYAGRIQLAAARLWQGQTTNFRTPGGGFAPVVVVE